ncbi:MAG: hypothetical protein WCA49_23460 [Candidatus Sulfotelmatobacter sp.]
MNESAVLAPGVDEEVEPGLMYEPQALNFLGVEYATQRAVNRTDAMD